jgi:hypothetical protein
VGLHRTTLLALWAYTPRHSTTRPARAHAPSPPQRRNSPQAGLRHRADMAAWSKHSLAGWYTGFRQCRENPAAKQALSEQQLTCRDTRLLLKCSGATSSSSSGSRCRRESTSTSSVWFLPSRFPPTSFNSHPLLGSGGGLRLYSAHVSYHTTAPLIPLCPKSPVGKTRVAAKSLTCRPAVPAKARRGAARLATALR